MIGAKSSHTGDAEPAKATSSNSYPVFRLNAFLTGLAAVLGIVVAIVIPSMRDAGFYVIVILLATAAASLLAFDKLVGDNQGIEFGSTGTRAVIAAQVCLAAAGAAAAILWSPWAILLTVSAAWDFALLRALARSDRSQADH